MGYDIWNTCMLVPWPILKPDECASWVQAWGSIGAVLAAVLVPPMLERQRHRRENAKAIFNAKSLAAGVDAVVESLLAVLPMVGKEDLRARRAPLQAAVDGALATMPLHNLPLKLVAAIYGLHSIAVQVVALIEDLEANLNVDAAMKAADRLQFYKERLDEHIAVLVRGVPKE